MVTFGLFPGKQLTKAPVPRGYAGAAIRAGELHESVFCSLKCWSMDDYVSHWRRTAERTLHEPQPSLFCSDLTDVNAMFLVAFPDFDDYRVEQRFVRRGELVIEGPFFSMRTDRPTPSPRASSWAVTRSEIEAFVRLNS